MKLITALFTLSFPASLPLPAEDSPTPTARTGAEAKAIDASKGAKPSPEARELENDWHLKHNPETFAQLPAAQAKLDREHLEYGLLSAAIAHATNAVRLRHGCKALKYSPALRECAFGHSMAMASHGFFSHENPKDAAMRTMSQRLAANGIKNVAAAENISSLGAGGHTYLSYAKAVVEQWMNSPGHRANMLSEKYNYMGCAAHSCGTPKFHLLATQNFASAVPELSSSAAGPTRDSNSQPAVDDRKE